MSLDPENVLEYHKQWMVEHHEAIRRAKRRLLMYLVFCAIVTSSSIVLLVNPPEGFAPPAGYRVPGEVAFLLMLLAGTLVAFFGLLAWLEMLMRRQTERTGDLIGMAFDLGRLFGASENDSTAYRE